MPRYEVYATRWNDGHIVEELIPARGLKFSFPLSDHGECSFSATVEPGGSTWRPALSTATSGILVTRDDQPIWSGVMQPETQSGPRTFDFKFLEWGAFFETVLAVPATYRQWNDHALIRDMIAAAQNDPTQNVGIVLGTSLGASTSDLTVNAWDNHSVEELLRQLGDAQGGPEWYFNTSGTFDNPQRVLVLADRAGRTTPQAVLEYVEGLRGGNVIGHPARQQTPGYTVAVAVGGGNEAQQLRATSTASDLLAAGFPRRTKVTSYPDVVVPATLQRHADADLAAARGMTTSYTLVTYDGDPDWTQVQRGDTVTVTLDTDVYGYDRPVVLTPRLLDLSVSVPDDGTAQVTWTVASVQGS